MRAAEQPRPVEPVRFPKAPLCDDFRSRERAEKCAIRWCGRCYP